MQPNAEHTQHSYIFINGKEELPVDGALDRDTSPWTIDELFAGWNNSSFSLRHVTNFVQKCYTFFPNAYNINGLSSSL